MVCWCLRVWFYVFVCVVGFKCVCVSFVVYCGLIVMCCVMLCRVSFLCCLLFVVLVRVVLSSGCVLVIMDCLVLPSVVADVCVYVVGFMCVFVSVVYICLCLFVMQCVMVYGVFVCLSVCVWCVLDCVLLSVLLLCVVLCSSVGVPTLFVCVFMVYCDVGWFVVVVSMCSRVCAVFV